MGEPASNERVTVAVLGEKLDNVSDKIDDLCTHYEVDSRQNSINTHRITSLELRQPTICPRHDDLVKEIQKIQIHVAKMGVTSGASGGVVVSVIAGIVFGVGKAAGWW
jgi:hypothetical protein